MISTMVRSPCGPPCRYHNWWGRYIGGVISRYSGSSGSGGIVVLPVHTRDTYGVTPSDSVSSCHFLRRGAIAVFMYFRQEIQPANSHHVRVMEVEQE